jgi:hypothetical protein
VTDTGHGMDNATIDRVFEPFFTTRPTGNGLGLATVRDIIREHRGALNVQSKPGDGSRFEIWLPRASSSVPAAARKPAGLPRGNGETVMLVAQNIECVMRDEEVLAALGYEPVGFSTQDSALAASRADPARFDIVVVGHFGSTAAAISLASAIHAVIPRVPIVLATKAAFEIAADTLVTAGIVDVVRWPLLADEVAVALAHGAMLGRNDATSPPRHAGSPIVSMH